MDTSGQIGVDDAIDKGEIVNRRAFLHRVEVGTAPFEGRRAIAARHQIVSAEIHLACPQAAQFDQELLALGPGCVVGLIGPKEPPDWRQHAHSFVGVDAHRRRKRGRGAHERAAHHPEPERDKLRLHRALLIPVTSAGW